MSHSQKPVASIALMYHDVLDGKPSGFETPGADTYKVSVQHFDDHLNALTAHHDPSRGSDLNQSGVRITFDDGGVSAHSQAADRLEASGWRGFFFVTTQRIGTDGFLSRSQIIDLDRRGHIIGSHSHSHPLQMARLSPQEIAGEWHESCQRLADIVGHDIAVASIPGGMYSDEVALRAQDAGIRDLFTSEPRPGTWSLEQCRLHGRYTVRDQTATQWISAVASGERWPRWQQRASWESRKLAKKALGPVFLQIRNRLSR